MDSTVPVASCTMPFLADSFAVMRTSMPLYSGSSPIREPHLFILAVCRASRYSCALRQLPAPGTSTPCTYISISRRSRASRSALKCMSGVTAFHSIAA